MNLNFVRSYKEFLQHSCISEKVILAFLSLVFFSLFSCVSMTPVTEKPSNVQKPCLAFENRVYDFGIAEPEQEITHTFGFTNSCSESVTITGVEAACSAWAKLISGRKISKDGYGKIRAGFKTKRFEGRQKTTIIVYSNDPYKPEIQLIIKGMVKHDVAVVPQGINFGTVSQGEKVTRIVKILQLSPTQLLLKRIVADPQYFSIRTSRFEQENNRGINIEITFVAGSQVGPFSDIITLHTNIKRRPRIDIPVLANIVEKR